MRRPAPASRLLAAALSAGICGALAPALAAQRAITVVLRDPSGAPVVDATGWLRTEPRFTPTALQDQLPATLATPLPRARTWTARSGKGGVLRFGDQEGELPVTAGSGYVVTADGLGALLPRLHPGRADRVTLQPLAAVTAPGGSEAFTLHAVAVLPGDRRIALPPLNGTEVRLPAGTYEVWGESDEGLTWRRLHLTSGARHELSFGGDAQRLRVPANALVHPATRPDLLLRPRRASGELLLRGPALAAPLVTWLDGVVTPPRVVPGPPTIEPRAWPPAADRRERNEVFLLADDGPDACLFGLQRNDDRSFRVVAYARAEGGELRMPPRADGDSWLLLLAEGRAPHAQPWSTTPAGSRLATTAGQPLTVAARAPTGVPAIDLAVVYVPDGQDAAAIAARTDAEGNASFGQVTAPGTLFVRDERYANQRVELDVVPKGALALAVTTGERCTGTATLQGGATARTIVVTLRDPSGRLQPNERTATVAAGETFSFAGLPDDRELVLFATTWLDGRTWSVRRRVRAGEPVELTLKDEDPVLQGGR